MNDTPKNLRFTVTHEWIDPTGDELTVGITHHAQELLGDMVFVELPKVGSECHVGEELGVLESVKAASDFYAPVSGEITAVNEQVNENPALVNLDAYGSGWLVKIRANNRDELESLLNVEDYEVEISKDH